MKISDKQLMQLMNQLRDHISYHERLSSLGVVNEEYLNWLCDLRNELTDQQSDELKEICDE